VAKQKIDIDSIPTNADAGTLYPWPWLVNRLKWRVVQTLYTVVKPC